MGRHKLSKAALARAGAKAVKARMKARKLETVRGSGNLFRDLGRENAEAQQFKALLAAEIVRALDDGSLTVRKAESLTRIAAADFSRTRNVSTVSRLTG